MPEPVDPVGARYECASCGTPFLVQLPPEDAEPPLAPDEFHEVDTESVPRDTTGPRGAFAPVKGTRDP